MEECFKCQTSEIKALLFDAIVSEGIVKICSKCSAEGDVLMIRDAPFQNPEKKVTMYERLSRISGVNMEKKIDLDLKKKKELKKVVDSNFIFRENLELKKELIHNFHWVVMRARRMRHLTQEQFAEEINEPEAVIQKIENGFSPERVDTIIRIEKCLGINLRKNFVEEGLAVTTEKFDKKYFENLTISDLYEMKKKREEEVLREG